MDVVLLDGSLRDFASLFLTKQSCQDLRAYSNEGTIIPENLWISVDIKHLISALSNYLSFGDFLSVLTPCLWFHMERDGHQYFSSHVTVVPPMFLMPLLCGTDCYQWAWPHSSLRLNFCITFSRPSSYGDLMALFFSHLMSLCHLAYRAQG